RRKVAREPGVPGLVLVGLDRVEDVALDVALVGLLIGPEVQTSVRVRLRVPEPGLSGDLLDERRMTASSDRAKRRVTAMLAASGATFKRVSTAARSRRAVRVYLSYADGDDPEFCPDVAIA